MILVHLVRPGDVATVIDGCVGLIAGSRTILLRPTVEVVSKGLS